MSVWEINQERRKKSLNSQQLAVVGQRQKRKQEIQSTSEAQIKATFNVE